MTSGFVLQMLRMAWINTEFV